MNRENRAGGKMSVVTPAYNEEENVKAMADAVAGIARDAGIPYELIFVDDGSRDGTWNEIVATTMNDPNVRGARFSRNFGKEAAVRAGLAESTGDCVAVLDCDLQHPPEKLAEMYAKWLAGADVVEGLKSSRGEESAFHAKCAKAFYGGMSKAARTDMSGSSDYKLMDAAAARAVLSMKEKRPFFRAMSGWVGFRRDSVTYDVAERKAGVSKWNFRKLSSYAIDNWAGYTTAPLTLPAKVSPFVLAAGLAATVVGIAVGNGAAAASGVSGILASAVMAFQGVQGYYLARAFEELQDRPEYLIMDRTGAETRGRADFPRERETETGPRGILGEKAAETA